MAYSPTAWLNNAPPPLSAANLNKLTNELKALAVAKGISHSLPTWADGVAPALTDAAPLNEMERVADLVAVSLSLSYTPTVWSSGWRPSRNAARFNHLEVAAAAARAAIVGRPPPDGNQAPPMPAMAANFQGPLVITSGGTYSGNWQSTNPDIPAIQIATTQPVIIQDSQIRHLGDAPGSRLIRVEPWGLNTDITLRRVVGWGGSHRFIEVEGHRNLVVENCSMNQTGGIRTGPAQPGATTVIRYNYHLNPRNTPEGFGNFYQCNGTRAATPGGTLVEWNQVVGQHNICDCEDTISFIGAINGLIRHNMLWHNSLPNNAVGTNGCITFESTTDCEFHHNYVVDSTACPYIQGDDHRIIGHHNRVIQDGYQHPPYQNVQVWSTGGWTILSPATGCHLHDNVFGWTGNGGAREEQHLLQTPGTPHTNQQEWDLNTHLPSPITRAMEEAEWVSWQADLLANSITIGA